MSQPEKLYVLHMNGDPIFITPYETIARQQAERKGLAFEEIPQGTRAYDLCLADYQENLARAGWKDPKPLQESSQASASIIDLEAQARQEWDRGPALRQEFGDFFVYLAYVRADRQGLIKTSPGRNTVAANKQDYPQRQQGSSRVSGEAVSERPESVVGLEAQARQEWDRDPALRQEFSEFPAYLAYVRADHRGLIRVSAKSGGMAANKNP